MTHIIRLLALGLLVLLVCLSPAVAAAEGWRDVVGEATHFHAVDVNPRWRLQRVAQIGNHIFYR